MKTRTVLITGALCLASVSFLSAKSFDVLLSEQSMMGKVTIPAGNYHLKVNGNTAQFVDADSQKTYTAPIKENQAPRKFDSTAVVVSHQNGTAKIDEIELGGSTTQVEPASE